MEPERRYSVLAVSSSHSFNDSIRGLLPESRYFPVTVLKDAASARRALLEYGSDLVIINAPLPDEPGIRLAMDVCERSSAGVLLMVKAEHYPDIEAAAAPRGILTLSKPTGMQMVAQNLRILCATRERMRRMEAKQATVEERIEEIRLINRAKWLLIECLGMTEPEAHRYIEKQSMDQRISKREVAESVIKTYK